MQQFWEYNRQHEHRKTILFDSYSQKPLFIYQQRTNWWQDKTLHKSTELAVGSTGESNRFLAYEKPPILLRWNKLSVAVKWVFWSWSRKRLFCWSHALSSSTLPYHCPASKRGNMGMYSLRGTDIRKRWLCNNEKEVWDHHVFFFSRRRMDS